MSQTVTAKPVPHTVAPVVMRVEPVGDVTQIAVGRDGSAELVRLIGVVDLAVSSTVCRWLTGAVERSRRVDVDLSFVRLLDAGSVNMFMRVKSHAVDRHVGFVVTGARAKVLETLRITGAASVLCRDAAEAPRVDASGSYWRRMVPVDAVADLLAATGGMDRGDPRRRQAEQRVVELCMPVAAHLARRYRNSSQDPEDLAQVAALALVKAVKRYDITVGVDFLGFAVPTVLGELRRYFRDATWSVHVPRRLKAMRSDVVAGREQLTHRLGRPPRSAELAGHLRMPVPDVEQAEIALSNYRSLSLDRPVNDGDGATLAETLGTDDGSLDHFDNVHTLRTMVAKLPARERHILRLRFFEEKTQTEIAETIGISQMHVSRLLGRTITYLRRGLLDDERPRRQPSPLSRSR
jgi:RNA polymerase sigma-B factor